MRAVAGGKDCRGEAYLKAAACTCADATTCAAAALCDGKGPDSFSLGSAMELCPGGRRTPHSLPLPGIDMACDMASRRLLFSWRKLITSASSPFKAAASSLTIL